MPAWAVIVSTVLSLPALALVAPEPSSLQEVVRPPTWILEQAEDPSAAPRSGPLSFAADTSPAARDVQQFRARAGGTWSTPVDRRTGRAALFQGSGIALFPGPGNTLKRTDVVAGILDDDGRATMKGVERLIRGFFQENGGLFLPGRGELVLNPDRSGILEDGRIAYADFDWVVDGVPVLGAHAFARINNGNLIQAGTRLIGTIAGETTPQLTSFEARASAFAHAGLSGETEEVVNPGRLILLPVADQPASFSGQAGTGVGYRLAWEVAFRRSGESETWTARVDAITAEVREFFDANAYAGQVTGGVYPRTVSDPEIVWPFPAVTVTGGAVTVATDVNGQFTLPTGQISAGLDGKYVNTDCQECVNPIQPGVSRSAGTGLLRFGTGGLDTTGNGLSTRADRNAFYHLNIVRLLAKKWLVNPYLETPIAALVNINASCNAFYNGSVNFYRSSSSCNNTGEIADVMDHEWGHGLDSSTAPGDGATGEGTADTVAVQVTHSNLVGPFFRKTGSPVRNLDKSTSSLGTLTRSNVVTKCGTGSGPLGREVHCEGQIYGQTIWDLATALVAKYGANTGWRESERIFFTAMPQSSTYLPGQSGSIYDAYIAADDDDGNLANGTPNGGEIYAAFNTHEIAGTPRSSSPHCLRPAQPVVTATVACDQIALSWNAVPGASAYRIQKHWSTVPSAFLDVATVTGTNYSDSAVTAGLTYHYVVQAVDGQGCESSINTEVLAAPTSRPRLDVSSAVTDDTPAGNHTGQIDPGESVDLSITLDNAGNVAATGIGNTLSSSTPGVTVTQASVSYPDLPAGGSAAGGSAYRIAIASSVACGTPISLNLATTAQGISCPLESNPIPLEMGTHSVLVHHDFEVPQGWTYDAASSTASTGAWIRSIPSATNFQPGEDVSAAGAICWFTGNNTDETTDDVDGGEVVLLSPLMDLSNRGAARLRYWRWFGQRDLGDDPTGDFFAVEVSSNGGSSWTTIERLGDDVNAAAWTLKEFAVESFVPLTNTMRFRVRVSDADRAGDDGDIIEGGLDEFQITGYTCDPTPPCFVAPTFAGLGSAAAGLDCGGVDLSWTAAATHCQNAAITYNVYRSTSAGFVPAPANLIAAGVASVGFHDTQLTPGTTYHYIVRANDSRAGEDANSVRRSVLSGGGTDMFPPTFAGIGSLASGSMCGETVLSWAPGQDICTNPVQYDVHRSLTFSFTPSAANLIAEVTSTAYVDAALTPGAVYAYIVRARDGAGNTEGNTIRSFAGANQTGGCSGCPAPVPVGTIKVRKSGNDVVLDWTADPVSAARYIAYRVTGPALNQPLRIGSTTAKTFTHGSALQIQGPLFYFVSAVNACGQQSAFDTEP